MAFSEDGKQLIDVYTKESEIINRKKHSITEEEKIRIGLYYLPLYDLYEKNDPEEIGKFYTLCANNGNYDFAMTRMQPPHDVIMARLHIAFGGALSSKSVMEFGAGTGLLGTVLHDAGFGTVDGIDLSNGMLEIARNKGAYNQLIREKLSPGEPTKGVEANAYDAAVSCSCFTPGHIPMVCVEEMCRIVKSGGHLVYTVRDPNYELDFMEIHSNLMKEGKATLISMQKGHYKWDATKDYESAQCYIVHMQVL